MPARTRVQLPLDHAAAVKRVERCLFELAGPPTVDDRAPFGCVSARTEEWVWLWVFELLVEVDLRPLPHSAGTEAIVSADAIDANLDEPLFELGQLLSPRGLIENALRPRASRQLVTKVSAALTAEVDIWASMRRRQESTSSDHGLDRLAIRSRLREPLVRVGYGFVFLITVAVLLSVVFAEGYRVVELVRAAVHAF